MRTTVTLSAEVASAVNRLCRERSISVSEAVNELARAGMARREERREPFVQRTHDLGLRIDVTNVPDALEQVEGPDYR